MAPPTGPLAGIRVVDVTAVILGPYCTQILGDMGAEVIKVEPPEGDIMRHTAPNRSPGMGAAFLNLNRNKRSLALDLKQAPARAALQRLVAEADVYVHSMRPQAAERLGMGSAALRAANKRLIYCAAYGFRAGGLYSGLPAFDDTIQAACGLAALQGQGGAPDYVRTVIADKTTGLMLAGAIAMALYARERTGEGQSLEVPMFETMVSFVMAEHLAGRSFEPPLGGAGYPRVLAQDRRPFRTKDGFIGILPYTTEQWRRFLDLAGRPELKDDARFADPAARSRHPGFLYETVAEILTARTTADWLDALTRADIPAMPVNTPDALLDDPHLAAEDFFPRIEHPSEGVLRMVDIPVRFDGTPGAIRRHAPRLGEHSRAILGELGYGAADIDALVASGATKEAAEVATA